VPKDDDEGAGDNDEATRERSTSERGDDQWQCMAAAGNGKRSPGYTMPDEWGPEIEMNGQCQPNLDSVPDGQQCR